MAQPVPLEQRPWYHRRACQGVDPDVFYPEKGKKGGTVYAAKRICAACPVRLECLEYALENGERYGVWGGLTERERRRLAERHRLAAPDRHYNRTKSYCDHGHPLDGDNLRVEPQTGWRTCKACVALRVREHRANRRAS